MSTTGRTPLSRLAAVSLLVQLAAAASADQPEPTPTPTPPAPRRELHLSEVADRTTLDRSRAGQPDGPVVISNDTVERLAELGALTTCSPAESASAPPRPAPPTSRAAPARISYWRRRVAAQRDTIARVTADIARLEARIESLEEAAFQGGARAARIWPQIDEAKAQRRIAEDRRKREQDKLTAIVREARIEGAEPGWFR